MLRRLKKIGYGIVGYGRYGQHRGTARTAQAKDNGTHLRRLLNPVGPLRGGLLSSEEITEQRTMAALARDASSGGGDRSGMPGCPFI